MANDRGRVKNNEKQKIKKKPMQEEGEKKNPLEGYTSFLYFTKDCPRSSDSCRIILHRRSQTVVCSPVGYRVTQFGFLF
jgi:hypothetical protein